MNESEIPDLAQVRKAAETLKSRIHRTPLLRSQTLDDTLGYPVWLKAENFQKIGAFKIRGATNWIARAREVGRVLKGVITYSSGNHGQAVALAARQNGLPAIIVVPENVSGAKLAAMRSYGAQVEFCGRTSEDRRKGAEEIASKNGYSIIPPFDDPWIVAGQGTIALEILEEQPGIASLVVPIGGGGMISGCAVAVKSSAPHIQIFGVQSERADSMGLSLEQGKRVFKEPGETIADGLRASPPGELNFEIAKRHVERVIRVSEEEIVAALRFLLFRCKILVEPSGAASLAALLSRKLTPPAPCAVVLSGGNIEPKKLSQLL